LFLGPSIAVWSVVYETSIDFINSLRDLASARSSSSVSDGTP
jgi:hypothetical protein